MNARLPTISLVLLGLCLTTVGCGQNNRLPTHPVAGQVTFRGQPLPNALLVLHPRDTSDPRKLPARAQTDASGGFQVTTYEQGDGAPLGEYTVTVQCYRLVKNGSSFEPGPNILPAKFSQPGTSDIVVRVAEGPNSLPPIALR